MATKRHTIPLGLLLAFLILAVFLPAVPHGFLGLDDDAYVTRNYAVRAGLTARGLAWAASSFEGGNWHPLTWFSHMLDAQLYALRPWGHHLTSVLLHALNALLLFLLLVRMTGPPGRSFLAAALFAIHPLRVESVAWVAERKDVLAAAFFLLTLGAWLGYVRRPDPRRYAAALALFALGLMAKPMVVTLPFVLLLIDWWPLGRLGYPGRTRPGLHGRSAVLIEKLPFFLLAALASVVTWLAQSSSAAAASWVGLPLMARSANAVHSYAVYLGETFIPRGLAVFYPHPEAGLAGWLVIVAVVVLVGCTVIALRLAGRRPYLATGWFWYLGMLVPVIGLIQVGAQGRADRYTYLPSIGIGVALFWTLAESAWRRWRGRGVVMLLPLFATLALLTVRQVGYWKDDETLFGHALEVTARNWLAENNLGAYLASAGRGAEAIGHYEQALLYKPDYPDALANIGNLLIGRGAYRQAADRLGAAWGFNPRDARIAYGLGLAADGLGDPASAERWYREALRLRTAFPEAHNNLATLLLQSGRREEGFRHLMEAARLNPADPGAQYNLGVVLEAQGDKSGAADRFRRALALDPAYPDAGEALARVSPPR